MTRLSTIPCLPHHYAFPHMSSKAQPWHWLHSPRLRSTGNEESMEEKMRQNTNKQANRTGAGKTCIIDLEEKEVGFL